MKIDLSFKKIFPMIAIAGGILAGSSLPGCGGCQGGKAPLGYAPKDAVLVMVVPSVGDVLTKSKAFFDRFKDNPLVSKGIKQGKAQLIKELGFDPEKPETLKKIGLDPGRGVVGHVAADGESGAVALGVTDEKVLEKYIADTAKRLTGGGVEFKPKDVNGVKVKLVMLKGSGRTMGAYTVVKKTLVFCPEAKDGKHAEYVAKLVKMKEDIGDNKDFVKVSKQVGKHQLLFYVDGATAKKVSKAQAEQQLKGASDFMKKYIKEQQETQDAFLAYLRGGALGIYISAKGAGLRSYLAVPEDKAEKLAALFKGKGEASEIGHFIGPDALMVGRISLDLKNVMDKVLETLSPRRKRRIYSKMEQLEKKAKIDVEKVVEELLAGRYAMAIYPPNLDPKANIGALMNRPEKALTMLSMVAFAQVTDTDKAKELLSNLERMMVMGRLEVRIQTGKDELKRYFLEVDGKKVVGWTVKDKQIVVATGDRLDKTLLLMEKGGDNVLDQIDNSQAKGLFKSDEGNVAFYNLSKTTDMVRGMKLPAQVKLMISPVLSMVNKLADLTASMEIKDAGILGELSLRLADQ